MVRRTTVSVRLPAHGRGWFGAGSRLVPALALPIDGKSDFVWPPEQLERLKLLQGMVTRLVTIGWRAAEPHFLELLRPLVRQDARCLVVTGGPDGESEAAGIQGRLKGSLDVGIGRSESFTEGFGELMHHPSPLDRLLEKPDT